MPHARRAAEIEEVKVVGKSGQISLGKRFAGKRLKVVHRADGTILLTGVAIVPESQLWTLEEPNASMIRKGLGWAAKAEPKVTDLETLAKTATRALSRKTRTRRK